ncbi:helix-turn-helix domain-containing protein [Halegenticoccus tardaugens]|uniref:helix-turn-helix domain-containing protein n=1 Tax=Halegenticoccus tardaugens TaxID=2071624 RepID=UPI00100B21C4|nr:helix-turn-helix domain-containing protein [Halegenticoccus tardaugens]
MQRTTETVPIPGELRSPRAKLVYLYLSTHGAATITELQEGLRMKKLSLYSVLRTLRERGLVGRDAERYVLR